MKKEKIAILGGGSWGSTLATHLAKNNHDIALWEYAPEMAKYLKTKRSLPTLPDLSLPSSVIVTNHVGEAVKGRDVIVSVTPSHTVRETFSNREALKHFERGSLVISGSKGLENETQARMSEIIREVFTEVGDIVILSGPSHAEEVAKGQPVVLVAASTSQSASERVRKIFGTETFRIYTGDDPIGVEVGGALKNIYALAAGIVDGLSLGDNTKAALLTRSLVEITRLGSALGAQPVTFFGLSGLGDLIVTSSSKHSRNRNLGEKIGKGKTLEKALKEMTMVAEGVKSTQSAYVLAKEKGVEVPIINEMYKILFENKKPKDSIKDLMAREVGAEMEGIVL